MNLLEKIIVICALLGQAAVLIFGFAGLNSGASYLQSSAFAFLIAATFILSVAAFVLILMDLYKRPFGNPNSKITWLLIILLTGGIGLLIYVFRYAMKPRITLQNA